MKRFSAQAVQATRGRKAKRPPSFRPASFDVVVTDLDRTFTRPDLSLDDRALAMARRLRQAGITCILASGRRAQDLEAWTPLHDAFDGFVLECGAVWGPWGDLRAAGPEAHSAAVREVARDLASEGCAVEEGLASCSVPADWRPRLEAHPQRPRLSLQPNRDRIDVVAAGIDKAVGLRLLLDHFGLPAPRVLSIGDGENDLPVFAMADRSVAVANAAAVVRQAADVVAPLAASEGFLWATKELVGTDDATPIAATASVRGDR
ncbi:MAG: HAD family hydrolase [Thermoplasmatota archaeon]